MEKTSRWLLKYKSDVYSQTGEDGILSQVLDIISEKDRWCVEFGAWDGKHLSNTRNLIENDCYSAVLIEGSKSRASDLKEFYINNPKVQAINQFVGFGSKDNLDVILKCTKIPQNFDFLSIDVDGNDYHIWKALEHYTPKVVCIEFNPTIATSVGFVQPPDSNVNQGSSLLSVVELAKEKGYELVSVLPFNAIFVQEEYFPLFGIKDNNPVSMREDLSLVSNIFIGYDGKIFIRGNRKLPWHKSLRISEAKLQQLPSFLRKYPENYSRIERFLFQSYTFLRNKVFKEGERIKT